MADDDVPSQEDPGLPGDSAGDGGGAGAPVEAAPVAPIGDGAGETTGVPDVPVNPGSGAESPVAPVTAEPIGVGQSPVVNAPVEPVQVYGASPPDFLVKHPWTEMLKLARAARSKKTLDRLDKVVALANKKGFVTRQDVQNLTHCGYVSAEIYISKLVKQNRLKKTLPIHKPQKYQPIQ